MYNLRRFSRDQRRNTAMIFAIVIIPLVFTRSVAGDIGRAYKMRTALEGATDAAALAVAKAKGLREMISRFMMASVIALSLTGIAMADTSSLKGPALKRTLSGKTLHIHTPLGVTMPVRFRGNGTMSGRAKPVLVRYTGSERDSGIWWIKGNRICKKWQRWFAGRSYCFSLRKNGRLVYWRRNDGRSGTGSISQ